MRRTVTAVLAAALVAGAAAIPAGPAAAAPTWSVVPSANAPGPKSSALGDISCPTSTSCFAIGAQGVSPYSLGMVEQWDGTSWKIVPLATPADLGNHGGVFLSDIACTSDTSCLAVGIYQADGQSFPLTERWDGGAWSIVASPPAGNAFQSVACPSVTSCYAVGSTGGFPTQTLIGHWDGSAWTIMTSPSIAGMDNNLEAVSCASTVSCVAVGEAINGGPARTLMEHWNGSSWSVVTSPTPAGTNVFPFMTGVACPSATSCYAVGDYENGSTTKTIVEQWNGTTWTLVSSPNVTGASNNWIADIACMTATDCFAVGTSRAASNGAIHDLFLRGGASPWTITARAANEPLSDNIGGVACAAATTCFVSGYNATASPATIEQWNGTVWSRVAIPQAGAPNSTLSDVSCKGTVCFAVGHSSGATGNTSKTLIERLTPTGWKVVSSPNPKGAHLVSLVGVSCPTTSLCFATGHADQKTLIERWNGKAWSIVPSPNNPQFGGNLTGVACVSSKFCFTVGNVQGQTIATLTERWDGTSWKIVPSPSRRPSPNFEIQGVNELTGVSCVSPNSCFAVGSDRGSIYNFNETLTLRWNGSKWRIAKSPNPFKFSRYTAVACITATNCYAVGSGSVSSQPTAGLRTLIAHWNGTAWTRVTSGDPGSTTRNELLAISCTSGTSCVAVGDARNGNHAVTLVKRLTGSAWSIESSAVPGGAIESSLRGIACASSTACVAVGDSTAYTAPRTLAERYG